MRAIPDRWVRNTLWHAACLMFARHEQAHCHHSRCRRVDPHALPASQVASPDLRSAAHPLSGQSCPCPRRPRDRGRRAGGGRGPRRREPRGRGHLRRAARAPGYRPRGAPGPGGLWRRQRRHPGFARRHAARVRDDTSAPRRAAPGDERGGDPPHRRARRSHGLRPGDPRGRPAGCHRGASRRHARAARHPRGRHQHLLLRRPPLAGPGDASPPRTPRASTT